MSLLLERLKGLHQDRRAADAMVEVVSRVLRFLSAGWSDLRRFYIVSQPLSRLTSPRRSRQASVTIRRVTACDPIVQRLPRPAFEIADRFQAGAECFVAERDDYPLAFVWVTRGVRIEPEVGMAFQPAPLSRAVWDFDLYVDPAARNSVVLARLWEAVAALLIEAGFEWTLSLVMAENSASLRAQRRSGSHVVAAGIRLRLGSRMYACVDVVPRMTWARRGTPASPVLVPANLDRTASYRRFRPAP
jgi:GNAT superfamily N-acetyltransferase